MSSKPIFRTAALAVALLACAVVASAQVTTVTGKVLLKQADGSEKPVQGAVIDIYRTDIKQKFEIKTDKKGQFTHAGIPFVGTFTVVVSAPGARPQYMSKMRFTSGAPLNILLEPGDGSTYTLEQIQQFEASGAAPAAADAPAAGSKEAKAAEEEFKRKVAEVEEQNKKVEASNATVSRTFKAGNDALNAGRLDEAITHYNEGLAARPDEVALLTNLAEALRRRGVERYNAAIRSGDGDAKLQSIEAAKKDWRDAATHSGKAAEIAKNPTTADPTQAQVYAQNKLAALSSRAAAMRLVATKVSPGDAAQAQAAWAAQQEYLAAETDLAKRAKARGEALQMLFDSGAMDLATAEARKVLAEEPDNVDANRILGLALFASGDKAQYQEAANFLQRYVDKAPDNDPLKASAKESLDYLKTAENVKPQSQPARSGGRRRP